MPPIYHRVAILAALEITKLVAKPMFVFAWNVCFCISQQRVIGVQVELIPYTLPRETYVLEI